ncbi:MAG: DUF6452 family protein [Flavobacteriaceae bacterium]
MKKNFLLLFVIALIISACEKDDFCTKETPLTPNLVLRFYDNANQTEFKSVSNLSVWAEGKDTLSNYISQNIDSIAIPLNTNATETIYNLKNSETGNLADRKFNKLTVKYTTQDVFISRSCGFKTIFNSVEITSDNGWFLSFTPNQLETINNEYNAHVKVYH